MNAIVLHTRSSALTAAPRPVRRKRRVALLGNFPPRRCGIATFTADVFASISEASDCIVVAMKDADDRNDYGAPVRDVIRQDVEADYAAAAEALNASGIEVLSLQHEFGIFGGEAGDHILRFLDVLKCAVVSTLHTVLKDPNDDQCRVLCAIVRRSARVIVMSELGRTLLVERYNTPPEKIVVIPHGAPDRPLVGATDMKRTLGLAGRDVLLTFGLLSPNKGIESVIRALPDITAAHPETLYVVLGATHPHQVLHGGEAYRESLRALAEDLGVSRHVQFVDKYVDLDLLLDYLTAADIYITPYLNPAQITSGTLSYAVALGKPVVSTPYWHAEELLADDVGVLVGFNDAPSIAREVGALLTDPERRRTLAERAYARGRDTIWQRSGETYMATYEGAIREHGARAAFRAPRSAIEPNYAAVARMSDDCGMLQHAKRTIPDRAHGYCVDDTARALMLLMRGQRLGIRVPGAGRLVSAYAAFVEHAWNEDVGRFRNFMSYDRQWLELRGSEDSTGRSLWALGETAHLAVDPSTRQWALDLAARVAPRIADIAPLRASAFCVLGLRHLMALAPQNADFATLMSRCSTRLHNALHMQRKPGWTWFEPTLTYDNARLPEALLAAGEALGCDDMRDDARAALDWLAAVQTGPRGTFQPVGNESFHQRYVTPSLYDQQPVEVAAMVDACAGAYAATGDARWIDEAARAHAWFLGNNVAGTVMHAHDGAGCHDGLGRNGVNLNQGAESLLAIQLANTTLRRLMEQVARANLPA